ncbi:type IV pilus secretin PilQ family protein, partial [Francisella tularensis subsp. holarctica]|nr:type IV pilus secretin PilQ family protein [Francisella tularensis subsp. holarctica]
MFFAKKKLLVVLTILGGLLGYDVSVADTKESQVSNQPQTTEQPVAKIVGREDNKDKGNEKHIKNLEFHRSLNGRAV